jgi:hypothetical protein
LPTESLMIKGRRIIKDRKTEEKIKKKNELLL